jgi:hypothetical protein
MLNYIIVDVRNGGVDGYYVNRTDANDICEQWKERLGHDDVLVASAFWLIVKSTSSSLRRTRERPRSIE